MKPIRYPARSSLLNVGCGRHYHPEWCNLDIGARDPQVLRHDIRRGLPFADESFGAIYHSHLLEHLAPESGRQFLQECLRVLRPGGVMRIVVPDLEIIASLYLEKLRRIDRQREQTIADYRWMTLELLDQMVRDRSGGLMGQYMTNPHIVNSDFVRADRPRVLDQSHGAGRRRDACAARGARRRARPSCGGSLAAGAVRDGAAPGAVAARAGPGEGLCGRAFPRAGRDSPLDVRPFFARRAGL